MGFLPKRAVNTNEVEIDRLYKLQNNCIEPVSFKVPRKVNKYKYNVKILLKFLKYINLYKKNLYLSIFIY